MTSPFDVAFDVRNIVGEGPLWDHRIGRLIWVDVPAGQLWIGDDDGSARILGEVDGDLTTAALAPDGNYVLTVDRDVVVVDPATWTIGEPLRIAADGTRFNDGAVDGGGRFWVGSTARDYGDGQASLWRVTDRRADEIVAGVGMSNGIDWSGDGRKMYWTDTLTRRVDMFDFDVDSGTASNRRPFVEIVDTEGYPDGLTVDDEDRVWVVVWNGGAIRCFAPDGTMLHHLELPVQRPTACAFGGDDLGTLFVTSASNVPDMPADDQSATEADTQPHAGAVFAASGLARGRPANEARTN